MQRYRLISKHFLFFAKQYLSMLIHFSDMGVFYIVIWDKLFPNPLTMSLQKLYSGQGLQRSHWVKLSEGLHGWATGWGHWLTHAGIV